MRRALVACMAVMAWAVLLGFMLLQPARAEFWTGAQLLEALTSGDPLRQASGAGYITGVFDASKGVLHCMPDPELKKLIDAYTETLKIAPPDELARTADQIFVRWAMMRFPCRRGPST